MNRPYIVCHMVVSLDGKVTGRFLCDPLCEKATTVYYDLNRTMPSDGFICGRVTMEESFTGGWMPDLSVYGATAIFGVTREDYIAPHASKRYAVAFDTHGRLGWQSNHIVDDDPGYGGAHIVEVLTHATDERYLRYLESLGVSYVFAGDTSVDVDVALRKLKAHIGIDRLLLEGGSIVNGAFLQADRIDELCVVRAPLMAEDDDKPLFMNGTMKNFSLTASEITNGVTVEYYKTIHSD